MCQYMERPSYQYLATLERWLSLPLGSKEELEAREELSNKRNALPDASNCLLTDDHRRTLTIGQGEHKSA